MTTHADRFYSCRDAIQAMLQIGFPPREAADEQRRHRRVKRIKIELHPN